MSIKKSLLTTCLLCTSFSVMALLPKAYQAKPATDKQTELYENVSAVPYTDAEFRGHKSPNIAVQLLKLTNIRYLKKSFTLENDEFKRPKVKMIHTFGSVASVSFRVTKDSPYTGLFEKISDDDQGVPAIIRVSLAKLPPSYTPGFALKLLVDGKKSQNIFSMFSLDGQGDNYNFFANSFESKIAAPKGADLKFLAGFFKKTLVRLGSDHADPTLQSTTDLAKVKKDGNPVAKGTAKSPFSLVFEPTAEAQMPTEKLDANDGLRQRLSDSSKFHKGLVLYKVYTRSSEGAEKEELGEIVVVEPFVASKYGDQQLFFQHNID